jgi:hypothetical protein
MNEIKNTVPEEYHEFINWFWELLAQEPPPHQTFNHQIGIKEEEKSTIGSDISFIWKRIRSA